MRACAQVGKGKVVRVSGIEGQGRTATVLLRGSNKLVLEEAERSLHDALCAHATHPSLCLTPEPLASSKGWCHTPCSREHARCTCYALRAPQVQHSGACKCSPVGWCKYLWAASQCDRWLGRHGTDLTKGHTPHQAILCVIS